MSRVRRWRLPTTLSTMRASGCPPRMSWACLNTSVALARARTSSIDALHGTMATSARRSSARLTSELLPGPSAATNSVPSASRGSWSRISFAPGSGTPVTPGTASATQSEDDRCGSQSASTTLLPCRWSHPARWTARVDFPTPPLVFAMTTINYHTYDRLISGRQAVRHAGFSARRHAGMSATRAGRQACLPTCQQADMPAARRAVLPARRSPGLSDCTRPCPPATRLPGRNTAAAFADRVHHRLPTTTWVATTGRKRPPAQSFASPRGRPRPLESRSIRRGYPATGSGRTPVREDVCNINQITLLSFT